MPPGASWHCQCCCRLSTASDALGTAHAPPALRFRRQCQSAPLPPQPRGSTCISAGPWRKLMRWQSDPASMRISKRQLCVVLFAAGVLGCGRAVVPPVEKLKPAPELDGGLTWLNSTPLRLAELRGKIVLLDFFEYSCVNCLRTFPYLQEWQR